MQSLGTQLGQKYVNGGCGMNVKELCVVFLLLYAYDLAVPLAILWC